jgi:hypothetical protein
MFVHGGAGGSDHRSNPVARGTSSNKKKLFFGFIALITVR